MTLTQDLPTTGVDTETGEIVTIHPSSVRVLPPAHELSRLDQNRLISLTEQIDDDTRLTLADLTPIEASLRVKLLRDFEELIAPKIHDRQARIEAHNNLTAATWRLELWLGKWLLNVPKNTGARGVGPIAVTARDRNTPPTLSDYHITKNQSSRWQKWAKKLGDASDTWIDAKRDEANENVWKLSDKDIDGVTDEAAETAAQAAQDAVDAEIEVSARYQHGDIVMVQNHVLICADNREPFVKALIAEHSPALAFCDPPYNAGVADWDSGDFAWEQDYLVDCSDLVAVTPGISSVQDFMRRTSAPYKWSMSTHISNGMTRGALGFGNWIYTALLSRLDSIHRNVQDAAVIAISSADFDKLSAKRQKPPRYLAWLFQQLTNEGDTIVDAFAGSAMSVIVAHHLGRTCIAVEKDVGTFNDLVSRVEQALSATAELIEVMP